MIRLENLFTKVKEIVDTGTKNDKGYAEFQDANLIELSILDSDTFIHREGGKKPPIPSVSREGIILNPDELDLSGAYNKRLDNPPEGGTPAVSDDKDKPKNNRIELIPDDALPVEENDGSLNKPVDNVPDDAVPAVEDTDVVTDTSNNLTISDSARIAEKMANQNMLTSSKIRMEKWTGH